MEVEVEGEDGAIVEAEGEGQVVEKDKISTSGPRLTRRESYRSDKKFQIRLTRSQSFLPYYPSPPQPLPAAQRTSAEPYF